MNKLPTAPMARDVMTNSRVIELALEAGFHLDEENQITGFRVGALRRFARLVTQSVQASAAPVDRNAVLEQVAAHFDATHRELWCPEIVEEILALKDSAAPVAQASVEPVWGYAIEQEDGTYLLAFYEQTKNRAIRSGQRVIDLYAAPAASTAPVVTDADRLDAELYRFIRSMIHMTDAQQEAAADAMASVCGEPQEGAPTDAEFSAGVDAARAAAAIAAAPKESA